MKIVSLSTGRNCGEVGRETALIDVNGEKLYIGDIVIIYNTTLIMPQAQPVIEWDGIDCIMGIGDMEYEGKGVFTCEEGFGVVCQKVLDHSVLNGHSLLNFDGDLITNVED